MNSRRFVCSLLEITMRSVILSCTFLALATPLSRADDNDDAIKKLQGVYKVVAVIVNGKPDNRKKDEVKHFEIKGNEIALKVKERDESATFKIDAAKKPAHFDITPKNETETMKGIYMTKETDDGLELTIAFPGSPSAERPANFEAKGDDNIVIKLLRKKEK
jgi:uncharacterized protein (TIGR03067 family)